MEAYEAFASIYDVFMEEIDYDMWVTYLHKIWEKEHFQPKLIADLGCGTGSVTQILAKQGYNMIGIDSSEDMLVEAKKKAETENLNILYILQDMREFELYGTVNCIISLCDSLNYITEEEELLRVFCLVNNYLHPKGLFIFDLNTEYKFKEILAQNSFAETKEDSAYIWENYYDEEEKVNEYYMNFFIKQKDGKYERREEYHYEKAYDIATIKRLLEQSGLQLSAVYDAYTFEPPKQNSQRIYFVAREVQKTSNCDVLQEEMEYER
ncbi:class I SAM-dependent methyltransferase [Lachnospiraceae bacterium 46-61]